MRLLFLSRWFPYPPDNGSKIRILNVLKQLSYCHEVSLVSFAETEQTVSDEDLVALGQFCASVQPVPYKAFRPGSPRALAGLLSPQPRSMLDTYNTTMYDAAVDALSRCRHDLVVASQLDMVPYALALRGVPLVLEELELTVYRDAVMRQSPRRRRLRRLFTWLKLSAYLRRTLPRFAACTVVSEAEQMNVRAAVPSYRNVWVVPNAVDLAHYAGRYGSPQPNTLVFCGALSYGANHDAARYLLEDIYPLVAEALPDARLRFTGSTAGINLGALPHYPEVEFTGYVPDIRPVVAQSWVSVVPLRIGGGTRLKILESMALGTPVVSTSKGAEGLEVTDGEDILLADKPREFADKVVQLLRSPELRRRIAAGGRSLVESRYAWSVVGKRLDTLVTHVASTRGVKGIKGKPE